jgi:ribose/xylose/arabinose/galactoside ABC-type transport system permease subunit
MAATSVDAERRGLPARRESRMRGALLRPETPAAVVLAALLVIFSVTAQGFLNPDNLSGILGQVAVVGIVALAVNQVILAGEIDISVGSLVALCAVVVGQVAVDTGALLPALAAGLAVGAASGLVSGVLSTKGRIPSILVTLGMLYALRGLVLLVTGSTEVTAIPDAARALGDPGFLGVGAPAVLLLVVFAVIEVLSRHSTWGRDVFAVGGNRRAARLAGLPLDRVRLLAFLLVGVCCAIAAAVYVGRVGAVQPNAATGLELQVIAAVVIGGTSIAGGRGSNLAPLVGAVLIGVILNGMLLLRVPSILNELVLGGLILVAVAADAGRRRIVSDR